MRPIVIIFALITFLVILPAHAQTNKEVKDNQPAIYMDKLVHDFGSVFERLEYVHVFKVENRGKADLIIEKVKPG